MLQNHLVVDNSIFHSIKKLDFVNFKMNFAPTGTPVGAIILYFTAPRSVRSSASTLRRASSKSLKHRTREEGAGKGEFAFTECTNQFISLAQNRGFCAKEEPQALKANKPSCTRLAAKLALRRRRGDDYITSLPCAVPTTVSTCTSSPVAASTYAKYSLPSNRPKNS